MRDTQLVDHFQRKRTDKTSLVIEGVQALKHTIRFGARLETIISSDLTTLKAFLYELAPEIAEQTLKQTKEVSEAVFQKLSPQPPRTKVIALAQRKKYSLKDLDSKKPVVFLEDPRDLENIGAVIRVAAAADCAGVVISGPVDIWHPAVIRGAAGLHFALPVLNSPLEDLTRRKLISLDPTGTKLNDLSGFEGSVLIFGTERHGVSQLTLEKSDLIIRLPMKSGVSSLNLATSVAATMYRYFK